MDSGRDPLGTHMAVKTARNSERPSIDRRALGVTETAVRKPVSDEERRRGPRVMVLVVVLVSAAAFVGVFLRTGDVSAYTYHDPFVIEGDAGLLASDAVTGGSGTELDPYVISGWDIHANVSVGIRILNTTAHLVVQGVYVHGEWTFPCVELLSVSNVTFADSVIQWGTEGLRLCDCADIALRNSTLHTCVGYGLSCCNVTRLSFVDSNVQFNDYGALFETDMDGLSAVNSGITDNMNMNALFERDLRNASFVNCIFNGCWNGDGVRVVGEAENLVFEACDVISNGVYGLVVEGYSHDLVIANSTISQTSGAYGICVRGDRIEISNNTLENNEVTGLFLGEADQEGRCTIRDNMLRWNWVTGIRVSGQTNSVIEWNVAESNFVEGFHFSGLDNCSVSWNSAGGHYKIGMFVNASVTNCTFGNNSFVSNGMFCNFDYCSNNIVENNTVNGLPLVFLERESGVIVTEAGQVIAHDCDGLTIRDMNMSFCTVSVELWGCTNCTLQNVEGSNNWYGIYVCNNSHRNVLIDCNLTMWNYYGLYLGRGSCNNTVSGCTIASCTCDGIQVMAGADNNTIVDSTVYDNLEHGVYCDGCSGTSVVRTTVRASSMDGICLANGFSHLVQNCTLLDNGYGGVMLSSTVSSRVLNNTIEGSAAFGISLWAGSLYNEIDNNTILNCNEGVYIRGDDGVCAGNRFTNNTLTSNSFYGLFMYYADGNTFAHNSVSGSQYGVFISGFDVDNNWFYMNSFYANDVNAYNNWAGNGNYWRTPTEVTYLYGGSYFTSYLGNHWDDYGGIDDDANGVGDSYYLFTNDGDMYPLMDEPPVYVPEYQNMLLPIVSMMLVVAIVLRKRHRDPRA